MNSPLSIVALSIALPLFSLQATAQGGRAAPSPEELQKRYDEELALPFVTKGSWVTDYDEARARAAKEEKLIFTYFSRSYAG